MRALAELQANLAGGLDEDWEENWDTVLDINVQGVMRCTKAVVGSFYGEEVWEDHQHRLGCGKRSDLVGSAIRCAGIRKCVWALQSGGDQLHAVLRGLRSDHTTST